MIEEIVEAWRVDPRVTLHLVDAIGDEGMRCTLSKRGGRNVVRQLAHLQWVRVCQLQKRAKPLAADARTFATDEEPHWRGLVPTVAYLIAHESHHRGSILLTLKECGRPIERKVRNGIWDWDRI